MDAFPIDLAACRGRQRRLLEVMQEKKLDLAVVTQRAHVQWLAGPHFKWTFSPAAALAADGKLTLVAPNKPPESAAADEVATYEAQWHSTMRNDQLAAASEALVAALGGAIKATRVGVEFSTYPRQLAMQTPGELVDLEPDFYRLRRKKDAAELSLIRKAIAGTEKMYQRAREIIRPGVTEIEVFNELQAAAVREFGEMMTETGNDYRCGARGGPPRNNRPAAAGELYILDLGPAFRGYFSDNCRTIAVSDVSDAQQTAWDQIVPVFAHVERQARPGKNCRELFEEVQALLDESPVGVFNHHLGHGIGLFPHEAPHLNPRWDDTFEAGDVFTAEPGLYAPELRAGIRLENDYVITDSGVELLTPFPLELK
jgi:Xaa-Pro aminopeptidase